jgi:SEC-C motif-containing protein
MKEYQYLLDTWHPDWRPTIIDVGDDVQWQGLQINGYNDHMVDFVAYYLCNGKMGVVAEKSQFAQDSSGNWVYIFGEHV